MKTVKTYHKQFSSNGVAICMGTYTNFKRLFVCEYGHVVIVLHKGLCETWH